MVTKKIKKLIYPIYEKKIFSPLHGYPTKFKIMRLYPRFKLRYYKNLLKYTEIAPSPFEILWIDPKKIDRFSAKEYRPPEQKISQLGTIKTGEWDEKSFNILESKSKELEDQPHFDFFYKNRFENSKFFSSVKELVKTEKEYEKTTYYSFWEKYYSQRNRTAKERCKRLRELYLSIKSNSEILPQKDMNKKKISKDYFDDTIVDISRDGEFLLRDGRHRVAIAIILGIDRIPVRVACRHKLWMKKLNESLENSDELDRDLIDHPDFERLEK